MQKHETTFVKSHQLCESKAVTELTRTSSPDQKKNQNSKIT